MAQQLGTHIPQFITLRGESEPLYFTWVKNQPGIVPYVMREWFSSALEEIFDGDLDPQREGYWNANNLWQQSRLVTDKPACRIVLYPWPQTHRYQWLTLDEMATLPINAAAVPVIRDHMADIDPKRLRPLSRRLVPDGYDYAPMPPRF